MLLEKKLQLSDILEEIAEVLDITQSQHEAAVSRYEAVGKWLGKEGSPLEKYNPEIYPQGSFRLGTVIKPITGKDEYDIDLVCLLESTCQEHTQKQIKEMVGDRLRANKTYEDMLEEEGRRCWTLTYAESTKFHMDILPSIPDEYQWLFHKDIPSLLTKKAILITDNEHPHYELRSKDWPKSNPKGYSEWFKEQMRVILNERKTLFAEQRQVSIEQVQDYKVKTPLQRAIQLLKRHRDIMFGDDEDRPISIIITTLAAKAYANQNNIYDAMVEILNNMEKYIEKKHVEGKEIRWVANPVNPSENFADKWVDSKEKEENFYKWLRRAQYDLSSIMDKTGINKIAEGLSASYGDLTVRNAMENYGNKARQKRETGELFMASATGMLGNSGKVKVENHTFYGKKK